MSYDQYHMTNQSRSFYLHHRQWIFFCFFFHFRIFCIIYDLTSLSSPFYLPLLIIGVGSGGSYAQGTYSKSHLTTQYCSNKSIYNLFYCLYSFHIFAVFLISTLSTAIYLFFIILNLPLVLWYSYHLWFYWLI